MARVRDSRHTYAVLERWPATAGEWGLHAPRGPLPTATRVKLASDLVAALEHIHTLRPALTTGGISMADLAVVMDREERPAALKLLLHPSRVGVGGSGREEEGEEGREGGNGKEGGGQARGPVGGAGNHPGTAGMVAHSGDVDCTGGTGGGGAGARSGGPPPLDTDAAAASSPRSGPARDVAAAAAALARLLTPLWPEAWLFVLRADPSRAGDSRLDCALMDRVLRLAPALVPADRERGAGSLRRDPLFWPAQRRLTFYGVASQWVEACARQLRGLDTQADVAGAELARAVRLAAKCRDGAWRGCSPSPPRATACPCPGPRGLTRGPNPLHRGD